jgi:hypothetical protein
MLLPSAPSSGQIAPPGSSDRFRCRERGTVGPGLVPAVRGPILSRWPRRGLSVGPAAGILSSVDCRVSPVSRRPASPQTTPAAIRPPAAAGDFARRPRRPARTRRDSTRHPRGGANKQRGGSHGWSRSQLRSSEECLIFCLQRGETRGSGLHLGSRHAGRQASGPSGFRP